MDKYFKNKYRIDSARLKGWDYSNDGAYFITIVTKDRIKYFGNIENTQMILSDIGIIAEKCWLELPDHFPFVLLDEFVVMPDHIHGIIFINNFTHDKHGDITCNKSNDIACYKSGNVASCRSGDVACSVSTTTNKTKINMSSIAPKQGSLSSIIRSYKSAVSKYCHLNQMPFGWQEQFFDRIIRNENEFYKTKKYIFKNLVNWLTDKNNN